MVTTLLSSKGQIVIPRRICRSHKWRKGVEFIIEESGDSLILKPNKPFRPTSFDEIYGCLKFKGRKKSLKEMGKAMSIGAEKSNATEATQFVSFDKSLVSKAKKMNLQKVRLPRT